MATVGSSKIVPHLWFASGALEAARFYVLLGMRKLDLAALRRAFEGR